MSTNNDQVTIGAEAIKLIQETAVRASEPLAIKVPGDLAHVARFLKRDGEVVTVQAAPPDRGHRLNMIADVIEFAKAVSLGLHGGGDAPKPVLWIGAHRVCVLIDDWARWDYAALTLRHTPQYDSLVVLEDAVPISQRDFIRLLRIDLDGCLPAQSNLIELVRSLKFSSAGQVESTLKTQRESMGKSISAAVEAASTLPEEITLNVRVYDVHDLQVRRPVRCAVEVFPHEQAFRLTPLPMELHTARETELAELFERIDDAVLCPVYRGEA